MTTEAYQRKLTAILYTDVAGYSRHTGGDEEGTHRRVMEILDFASARISEGGGKVLRYAGDAILAEFSSTVSAVRVALDIQSALARDNRELDDDRKVQIRVGINIGGVIEDRGEVFGDGVNLAARLEAAAPEGGICISGSVYEQIRGKLDVHFNDDGDQVNPDSDSTGFKRLQGRDFKGSEYLKAQGRSFVRLWDFKYSGISSTPTSQDSKQRS